MIKNTMKFFGVALLSLGMSQDLMAGPQKYSSGSSLLDKADETVHVIQLNSRTLSASDIREISALLSEIQNIARGRSGGGYYPGRPGGGQHGQRLSTVVAEIQDDQYSWRAGNTRDLLLQCIEARKRRSVGNVDVISVSIDYGDAVRERTSGWYRGILSQCGVVAKLAQNAGLNSGNSYGPTTVAFSVDNDDDHLHIIEGHSAGEIGDKCMSEFSFVGNYDNIEINVDGKAIVKQTTSGWWRSSAEACRMVVKAARENSNIR